MGVIPLGLLYPRASAELGFFNGLSVRLALVGASIQLVGVLPGDLRVNGDNPRRVGVGLGSKFPILFFIEVLGGSGGNLKLRFIACCNRACSTSLSIWLLVR